MFQVGKESQTDKSRVYFSSGASMWVRSWKRSREGCCGHSELLDPSKMPGQRCIMQRRVITSFALHILSQ